MASPPSGGGGSGGGGGGELFDLMSPNPHEEAESHARHGHCACHGGGVDEVMPSYVFQPIRAAAPAAAAPASAASLRGSLDSMAASSNLKKGTIVEKSVEEVTKDSQHLRHLISICEEERQVGETALNDTSSRSHQIIRLTVGSRLREVSGCVKSFVASLNFVDLAGSERAAQTHANGARLKEGCHINRSLLTLTTVIRKLRPT